MESVAELLENYCEKVATEQHQIYPMPTWLDEPSDNGVLAWGRSDSESDCNARRLEKLPASPFRSIGGYLNYAGWPDCQRFLELDRAIQRQASERRNAEDNDRDDYPAEPCFQNALYNMKILSEGGTLPVAEAESSLAERYDRR